MKLETAAHWRQTMKLYHDVCPVSGLPGSHPPVPALSVSPTLSLESCVLASSVWVSSCTSASAHGLEEPSRERVVFVGPPPLWLAEDRTLAPFTSKTRVLLILSRSAALLKNECSQVSKFIIKLQINYFVLKCLKFFFKYSKQQTLKYFLLYVTIQLIPQNAI